MGPIFYLPGLFHLFILFFFTLNRDLTDSHTGSAPEARKGIGSPAAGAASTRPLVGRHSRSYDSNAYSEGYGTEQREVK